MAAPMVCADDADAVVTRQDIGMDNGVTIHTPLTFAFEAAAAVGAAALLDPERYIEKYLHFV